MKFINISVIFTCLLFLSCSTQKAEVEAKPGHAKYPISGVPFSEVQINRVK